MSDTKYAGWNVARLKKECNRRKLPAVIKDANGRIQKFSSDALRLRLAEDDRKKKEAAGGTALNPGSGNVAAVAQQEQPNNFKKLATVHTENVITVTVPANAQAGDKMQVTSPSTGKVHNVEIPAGLKEGQTFNVTLIEDTGPSAKEINNVIANPKNFLPTNGLTTQNPDAALCCIWELKPQNNVSSSTWFSPCAAPPNQSINKVPAIMGDQIATKVYKIDEKNCVLSQESGCPCSARVAFFDAFDFPCANFLSGAMYCYICDCLPFITPFCVLRDCSPICCTHTNNYCGFMFTSPDEFYMAPLCCCFFNKYIVVEEPPAYEKSEVVKDANGYCQCPKDGDFVGIGCCGHKSLKGVESVPALFVKDVRDVVWIGEAAKCDEKVVWFHEYGCLQCGVFSCSVNSICAFVFPFTSIRDCAFPKCKSSNVFSSNGFSWQFVGKDEIYSHCMCCSFEKYERATDAKFQ